MPGQAGDGVAQGILDRHGDGLAADAQGRLGGIGQLGVEPDLELADGGIGVRQGGGDHQLDKTGIDRLERPAHPVIMKQGGGADIVAFGGGQHLGESDAVGGDQHLELCGLLFQIVDAGVGHHPHLVDLAGRLIGELVDRPGCARGVRCHFGGAVVPVEIAVNRVAPGAGAGGRSAAHQLQVAIAARSVDAHHILELFALDRTFKADVIALAWAGRRNDMTIDVGGVIPERPLVEIQPPLVTGEGLHRGETGQQGSLADVDIGVDVGDLIDVGLKHQHRDLGAVVIAVEIGDRPIDGAARIGDLGTLGHIHIDSGVDADPLFLIAKNGLQGPGDFGAVKAAAVVGVLEGESRREHIFDDHILGIGIAAVEELDDKAVGLAGHDGGELGSAIRFAHKFGGHLDIGGEIVVDDVSAGAGIGDGQRGLVGEEGAAEADEKVFIRFNPVVGHVDDADPLHGLAGGDGQTIVSGHVIVVRSQGGAVGGEIVHPDILTGGMGKLDAEAAALLVGQIVLGTVTLIRAVVDDRDGGQGVIVDDGARRAVVKHSDGHIAVFGPGADDGDGEGLVALIDVVIDGKDGRQTAVAGVERDRHGADTRIRTGIVGRIGGRAGVDGVGDDNALAGVVGPVELDPHVEIGIILRAVEIRDVDDRGQIDLRQTGDGIEKHEREDDSTFFHGASWFKIMSDASGSSSRRVRRCNSMLRDQLAPAGLKRHGCGWVSPTLPYQFPLCKWITTNKNCWLGSADKTEEMPCEGCCCAGVNTSAAVV